MRRTICSLCLVLALPSILVAQREKARASTPPEPMPVDSAVTIGRLPNGLRYYIRVNHRPEKRAELRLVVNAGSVLEDPDQLGLAHFVEHMAFNGTEHFAKQALVSYIEGIGMQFGADLNASTDVDRTIYQLVVPTDSAQILAQGIQILEDWAHGITFDTTEVRKERGVVIEEWRLGQGAGARLRDKVWPVLFRGSRYASRLPIGTKESLDHFTPAALRRFYRDWYRPDLMAVVAVGDFDGREVERLIRSHFARIPARKAERRRPDHPLPKRSGGAAAIASDKEATGSQVRLFFFRPARARGTVAAYRASLVSGLYSQMLSGRLDELAQRRDPPFIDATGGVSRLARSIETFSLGAMVPDSGIRVGLEAVLTEVQRVRLHGFVASELERAKRRLLRELEYGYAERDKAESADLVEECINHFLDGDPMPGIARELALARQLLPGITLDETNRAADAWLELSDRAVVATGPDRPGLTLPPGDSLLALLAETRRADVPAYQETIADGPLVAADLPETAIVTENHDSSFGITTWTLANGVRVILKPTDFKQDEVLVTAFSPGGSSLVPDSLVSAARVAAGVVRRGGVARFSAVELQKKLAGALAQVGPYIGTYQQGLSGGASSADLKTLFELIYLHLTAPRTDSAAFQAFRTNLRGRLADRSASPDAAFEDTLQAILTQHRWRARPLTAEAMDSLDLDRTLAVYRDRFADASQLTIVLVGSFTLDSIRPLVRRYLGNLPALHRGEEPRDLGLVPPAGVVQQVVRRGVEPQSQTAIVFSGALDFSPAERFMLTSVASLLEMRLRAQLREELGGTYAASVTATPTRVPRPQFTVEIRFGSAPDRADELIAAVFSQIDSLQRGGPTDAELAKLKETAIRERETELRQNEFWIQELGNADQSGEDLHELLDLSGALKGLTADAMRRAAERYIDPKRYVRVTLVPETGQAAAKPGESSR